MPNIAPFEKYREQYEDWFLKNRFSYQSEIEAIKLFLPEGQKGIEIGVGTGQFSVQLGIKIGIEPSKTMGELAKLRGVHVIGAVAENLPLKKLSFDFALMVTTICFLDDILTALKEVYRVLKEKGTVIIGFIDKNSPLGKTYQEKKANSIFYKKATFYSADEVMVYLTKAGFKELIAIQTIFSNPSDIKRIEKIQEGYGKGLFVVIKGIK